MTFEQQVFVDGCLSALCTNTALWMVLDIFQLFEVLFGFWLIYTIFQILKINVLMSIFFESLFIYASLWTLCKMFKLSEMLQILIDVYSFSHICRLLNIKCLLFMSFWHLYIPASLRTSFEFFQICLDLSGFDVFLFFFMHCSIIENQVLCWASLNLYL